jgi:RsiW-degrading membrane proteinase PrsW (M82 family)
MKYLLPSHPIWKLARLAIVGGLLLGFLALNYNRLDSRDTMTIFGTLAGLLGFDALKEKITHEKPGDDKPSEGGAE